MSKLVRISSFIKNKYGEPAISNVDHGSCELESPTVRYGLGGVLLREICYWVRDIHSDADEELVLDGSPVVTRAFQEFMAKKAIEISENQPEVAKRLLEYNWDFLARYIHKTILKWISSLSKDDSVKDILVIDSYWDDAGEIIFLGLDWHAGDNYDDAMSDGANVIDYPLDFTSFYKYVLGSSHNEKLNGRDVMKALEDDYSITRDILAYLSVENLISISNGEEFKNFQGTKKEFISHTLTITTRKPKSLFILLKESKKNFLRTTFQKMKPLRKKRIFLKRNRKSLTIL